MGTVALEQQQLAFISTHNLEEAMKGDNPLVHRIPVKDGNGHVIGHKEVISYRTLLSLAHKERLSEVSTELVQAPTKDNGETAIVSAMVKTSRGTFTGIGDANPRNVNAKVAPHAIRMAETRAESRALRKALDIGVVALEELGDDLDDNLTYEGTLQPSGGNGHSGNGSPAQPAASSNAAHVQQNAAAQNGSSHSANGYRGSADNKPTDNQRRFLFRLLAERGMHGEQAREYIHRELGVTSLDDASKTAVSTFIDSLKGGTNGHNGSAEPGSRG